MLVFFSVSFMIAEEMGWMSPDFIKPKLEAARESTGGIAAAFGLIVLLLIVDILLPIPSSVVMMLSGFLLGPWLGGVASFTGAMAAAWIGFFGCRYGGAAFFTRIVGKDDISKVEHWFNDYGIAAIIISRPVPMLTEILSCLAGLSKVNVWRFTLASIVGTLPICIVYSYFGSKGTLTDPWPAVWVAVLIPAVGWLFTHWVNKLRYNSDQVKES